jgi:hypothetical protein
MTRVEPLTSETTMDSSARPLRRVCLLLTLSGLGACQLVDVAPATPQRPTYAADTNTTAHRTFELEAGGNVDPGDSIDTPIVMKYGAGVATEAFVGWSPYIQLNRSGMTDDRGSGDVLLGTRHRFHDIGELPFSSAVQLTTKVPTASEHKGIGSGEYDFTGAGILTGAYGRWGWTTYYELGMLGQEDDGGHDTRHALALSLGTPLTAELGAFAEIAGLWTRARSENPVFTTFGMTFSDTPGAIWDAGMVVGLNDDAVDAQIVFGLTRNLGRLFSDEPRPGIARGR